MKRKPSKKLSSHIAIAACLVDLGNIAPTEFRLMPAGYSKAKDGRPHNLPNGWLMNEAAAKKVIANLKSQQDDLLVDYEHQTLYAESNGQPAPAAAWFNQLEWRDDGLYVTGAQWTDAAKTAIEAREYRYISPVMAYDKKTGEVNSIVMASLVNYPAIDGLTDLAAAHFNFYQSQEESIVDEELLELLGLDKASTQEQVNLAVTALKTESAKSGALETEIATLKADTGNNNPDPAKFVPIEAVEVLKQEFVTLSNQVNKKESEDLVTEALKDGRLLAAQKEWAESLDVVALKDYLKAAQPVAALKGMQSGGNEPEETGENGLTESEMAICKATMIDPEDFKKSRGDK